MLDLLSRDEVLHDEFVEDADGDCIYCICRPLVSFCGRYVEGELVEVDSCDDECCPDCLAVEAATGCPACGVRP